MGLKFVLLSFALVASGLRFTLAAGDTVQQAIDLLNNGTEGSTRLIEDIRKAVNLAENAVREAQTRMEQITEKMGTLGVAANGITKEAFEKYDKVKKEVRGARRKLRSLADKTKNACEDMELYIQGWDEEDHDLRREYLKEQLTIMKDLMTESIAVLTEAEKKYEVAIDNIDVVNTKLRDFVGEMNKMLDTTSDEHKKWKTNLRAGVYTANGGVSLGLLVADVGGCLGLCSVVGNTITWGTSIPVVETSIAFVEAKLKELKSIGDQAKYQVGRIKTTTGDLIKVLDRELNLVTDWKNDAQYLNGKLDRMDRGKFERLPLYRDSFAKAVRKLRESAEDFLNQPVNLFEETTRKRRSLLENAHRHQRNY